jgi:hypothetical protein
MNNASLNITVIGKRMLSQSEAASYTGLSIQSFRTACEVTPIAINPKKMLWDKHDLDRWIDDLKSGSEATDLQRILDKL